MVQNPSTSKLAKRAGSGPKYPLLSGGGVPSFLSVLPEAQYPQNGSCLHHPSITKSIPVPRRDRRCLMLSPPVEEKAAVLALPQPSLRVMEMAMAGTSPIILLTMQN